MPDYKKMTWVEVFMIDGFKFVIEKSQFMSNYANLVGQHISRIAPYNQAYKIKRNGTDKMTIEKFADDTIYINFNQTVRAQKITKEVEVIE